LATALDGAAWDLAMPDFDAEAFRRFEREAHGRKAVSYHERFAAVTQRAIAPLLDAARVGAGTRLLDVAAGPGHLAAAAARRGARVTGVDLAPEMVAIACRLYPTVTFQEAQAEQLPFPDGSFDAVTCAFGVGHFPEPECVLAEFSRVLAPGGVAALAWWDGFARNRINGIFHETILLLGVSAPHAVPAGPPMDRYSDGVRFAELLDSAGLEEVAIGEVSFEHRVHDADELWMMAMGSFARASSLIGAQSEAVQRDIRAAVGAAASRYATADGLAIPVAFLIASGMRAA